MRLELATKLAERIQAELAPMCEQIAIAGSVRRQRPECGDIDLVLLPRRNELANLKARCLAKATVVQDGPQNFICKLNPWSAEPKGFQLDIFIAAPDAKDLFAPEPGNFASLLLCRTGSKEHNVFLIEHAKKMQMRWNPYRGVYHGGEWKHYGNESEYLGGELLAARHEPDIFEALKLAYVPPEQRER
jgi:DNA polymerase/3'-5' exonuclease PolX